MARSSKIPVTITLMAVICPYEKSLANLQSLFRYLDCSGLNPTFFTILLAILSKKERHCLVCLSCHLCSTAMADITFTDIAFLLFSHEIFSKADQDFFATITLHLWPLAKFKVGPHNFFLATLGNQKNQPCTLFGHLSFLPYDFAT